VRDQLGPGGHREPKPLCGGRHQDKPQRCATWPRAADHRRKPALATPAWTVGLDGATTPGPQLSFHRSRVGGGCGSSRHCRWPGSHQRHRRPRRIGPWGRRPRESRSGPGAGWAATFRLPPPSSGTHSTHRRCRSTAPSRRRGDSPAEERHQPTHPTTHIADVETGAGDLGGTTYTASNRERPGRLLGQAFLFDPEQGVPTSVGTADTAEMP
jgi:hypothetical protein